MSTGCHKAKKTDQQTDRKIDRQEERQSARQTDRMTVVQNRGAAKEPALVLYSVLSRHPF